MQNAFTYALRQIRPNRVFLPTSADLHPDHRIVHEELLISLFHAQGNIWPELGEPIAEVPKVYEFAVYCDFPEPPQIRIEATPEHAAKPSSRRIRAYASQEQIEQPGGNSTQRRTDRVSPRTGVPFLLAASKYHPLFTRTALMTEKICYLGDVRLDGRGKLSGRHHDALRPGVRLRAQRRSRRHAAWLPIRTALYVVSDYPAAPFRHGRHERTWPARSSGRGPGDVRRLGELFRPAGRISPIAAGRGLAGGDAIRPTTAATSPSPA